MATPVPTLADRYRLEAPESDVGLYDTWRATDLARDLVVRVERLPRPSVDFAAHLTALRALSDVGLAPVLDGGLAEGGAFLVTERDDDPRALGHWLAGHRAAGTLPSPGVAQRIFERIVGAVRSVHEARGLLRAHGALCPRNVLLRRVGAQHSVRLLGVGSLHRSTPADAAAAWQRAAPFVATGTAPSVAGDVAALAALHLALLTAREVPASGETWATAAARGGVDGLRSLVRATRDDVPDAVLDVLAPALTPSARPRFASLALFAKSLRDAWNPLGHAPPPAATDPEPPAPVEARDVASPRATGGVPEGWQTPERAVVPPTAPAPTPDEEPRPRTLHVDLLGAFVAQAQPAEQTRRVVAPVDAALDEGADPTEAVALVTPPDDERTDAVPVPLDDDDDEATRAKARPAEVVALATALLGVESPFGGAVTTAPSSGDPFATDRVTAAEVEQAKISLSVQVDTEKVSAAELDEVRASLADGVGVSSRIVVAPSALDDATTAPAPQSLPAVPPPDDAPTEPAAPLPSPPAAPLPSPPSLPSPAPLAVGPIVAAMFASLALIALALAWALR